jgi:hypothetical protein
MFAQNRSSWCGDRDCAKLDRARARVVQLRGREGGVVISTVRPVYAIAALILGALALGTTGCAAVNQADRGYLSDPIMIFDENAIEKGVGEHYRDYREGSVGGTGAQSGGCGCG